MCHYQVCIQTAIAGIREKEYYIITYLQHAVFLNAALARENIFLKSAVSYAFNVRVYPSKENHFVPWQPFLMNSCNVYTQRC